jgi:exopolyphosphatase/guanosine-5'-triphosphate,3'-diphosphate pyrophosphatase
LANLTGQVALIGIGSNSVRLLITTHEGGRVEAVDRGEAVTRLAGYKITPDGRLMLTQDAMRDTVSAAASFAGRARERGAILLGVVATEAVRSASNADELTQALERDLGMTVNVISGEEEATLGWLALSSSTFAGADTPFGVIDIGGGSSDLSVGLLGQNAPGAVASIETGGRTAMRRFGLDRPIERTKLMGIMAALQIEVAHKASALRPTPQVAVVIGGTASVLAAMYRHNSDAASSEGDLIIDAAWLDTQLKDMSLLDQAGRVAIGVPPDRADIIVAGAAILLTLLQAWGLTRFYASERNILDGYLQKNL